MRAVTRLPLFWRVCLINGVVFLLGTALLAFTPATVSSRVVLSEAVVLVVGLGVIVTTNALLLRGSLAPLDRLARRMDAAELSGTASGGSRDAWSGGGVAVGLEQSFEAMMARLERERRLGTERALAAQEAERSRISRELHDEVGQNLTVVLLGLSRAVDRAPVEMVPELESLREAVRAGLEDVRGVARRLRPDVLADLGLQAALVALTRDIGAQAGLRVRRSLGLALPDLPEDVELVVYRIAQEALTNVARHAHASGVEVALSRQGTALVLTIADNGRGLRGAVPGAGVRGMTERAELIEAELSIGGREGGGTVVRLVVPERGATE